MTRLSAVLALLCVLAACSTEPSPPQMLSDRMAARLAPEIADGTVVVQPLVNGTQIAIAEQSLFPTGGAQLDDKGRAVLTYVIQALLEPTILQIGVADASDSLQGARAQAVSSYFREHSLGPQLAPTDAPAPMPGTAVQVGAPGTPIQGATITVTVVSG